MRRKGERAGLCRRPWSPDAIRSDPLGFMAEDRAAQRALADLLEDLADALPAAVSRPAAALAAARLRRLAAQAPSPEETALFMLIETHAPADAAARQVVAIARREGALLAGLAIELAEALDALAHRGAAPESEALGYMMRACFDGMRRRLDWLEAVILPQARAALTPMETRDLGEHLAAIAARQSLRVRCGLAVIDGARAAPSRKSDPQRSR